jgi:hypothetical protein
MSRRKNRQQAQALVEKLNQITLPSSHGDEDTGNLDVLLNQPIALYPDLSKFLRMKKFRFQLLHQWLANALAPCKAADIGGGKGLLGYLLQQSGWEVSVIDPVIQELPDKYKDIATDRRVKIRADQKVAYIQREFVTGMAQDFDLLIGMHAHGCNAKILDAAAEFGCGFVIFPCCVIDEPFYPPLGVHWLESLADYGVKRGLGVRTMRLNFKGQNIGLYSWGKCQTLEVMK